MESERCPPLRPHQKNGIEIWDLLFGKIAVTFAAPHAPTALAFSPDGNLLASGDDRGGILIWDVKALANRNANDPAWTADDKNRLWSDLADTDAAKAFDAMMRLKRNPAPTVALLGERLRWKEADLQMGKLIQQLDSDDFATRQKASAGLEEIGERARPMLAKALTQPTSVEHKRRVELLLAKLAVPFTSPAGLQLLRSIEVLDGLRTPEAAALLRQISAGAASDEPLAREIARALHRYR